MYSISKDLYIDKLDGRKENIKENNKKCPKSKLGENFLQKALFQIGLKIFCD